MRREYDRSDKIYHSYLKFFILFFWLAATMPAKNRTFCSVNFPFFKRNNGHLFLITLISPSAADGDAALVSSHLSHILSMRDNNLTPPEWTRRTHGFSKTRNFYETSGSTSNRWQGGDASHVNPCPPNMKPINAEIWYELLMCMRASVYVRDCNYSDLRCLFLCSGGELKLESM